MAKPEFSCDKEGCLPRGERQVAMEKNRILSLGFAFLAIGGFSGIASAGNPERVNAPSTSQDGRTGSPSLSAQSDEPLRKSNDELSGNALRRAAPIYPTPAKKARVQGDVVVEVTINRQGDVESARPLDGPLLLQEAATKAALKWNFRPTLLDGKPVRVIGSLTFRFKLGSETVPTPTTSDSTSKIATEIEQFLEDRTETVPDFVSGDRASVMVVADGLSPQFISQLETLGFKVTRTDEQWATIGGSIPLLRIHELAKIKGVRFIAPGKP